MKQPFKDEEIPFQTLEQLTTVDFLHDSANSEQVQNLLSLLNQFGLTREMIEDLPMDVLHGIGKGRRSPVLPIHMTDENGATLKSRTRFQFVRMDSDAVDVVFYPVLKQCPIDKYNKEQQELLQSGKTIIADMEQPDGGKTKMFVQIDPETNQVIYAPTPVIGRNLQVLSNEMKLSAAEIKVMQNGDPLTFVMEEEPVTIGIDLNAPTGIRFAQGDSQQWRAQSKREWDKYTFGCYGCWTMDEDGNLDYTKEEDYTEELWNELSRKREQNIKHGLH